MYPPMVSATTKAFNLLPSFRIRNEKKQRIPAINSKRVITPGITEKTPNNPKTVPEYKAIGKVLGSI